MTGTIVVGVDGSDPAKAALRWALRQAELTGAELLAISAWETPPVYGWDLAISWDDLSGDLTRTLDETIAEITGGRTAVTIDRQVHNRHPAHALMDAAEGAEALVLGNRGRGGFTSALLGSVTQYCTHHATCPVVVVRP